MTRLFADTLNFAIFRFIFIVKKILSISLAILFLFSTINLNIMSHYCGGRLVETKVILGNGKVSCGMEEDVALCENYPGTALEKNCCEDDWHQISIKDDYTTSHNKTEFNKTPFAISGLLPLVTIAQNAPARFSAARYKSPPDSHAVCLLFIRVFLV